MTKRGEKYISFSERFLVFFLYFLIIVEMAFLNFYLFFLWIKILEKLWSLFWWMLLQMGVVWWRRSALVWEKLLWSLRFYNDFLKFSMNLSKKTKTYNEWRTAFMVHFWKQFSKALLQCAVAILSYILGQ